MRTCQKSAARLLSVVLILSVLLCGCDLSFLSDSGTPTGEQAKRPNTIENFHLKHLLQDLDTRSQENIFALYYAAMHFEETCYLPYPMPQERASALLATLCYECPELFQLDLTQSTSYSHYENDPNVFAIKLPYCMDENTYHAKKAQVVQVLSSFDTAGMDAAQAEKYLYDTLCSSITYSDSSPDAGNAYGALVQGLAKCDGIAYAMKWAMENAGFVCLMVAGDAVDGGIGHAWNILPIDGVFYHLDVTADVKTDTRSHILYPAYNVNMGWLVRYYTIYPFLNIPADQVDMQNSYHGKAGNYFTYQDDWRTAVKQRFVESYHSGEPFTLQFSTQVTYESCLSELEALFKEAASQVGFRRWSWSTTYIEKYHLISVQVTP